MKKILLLMYLAAGFFAVKAQTLYTTTTSGGNFGGGTLNKFVTQTNSLSVLKSFDYDPKELSIIDHLVLAPDGKFYGTGYGRREDMGIIFSFDPVSKAIVNLHNFDALNGSNPAGGMVLAGDGKMYGVTRSGGAGNNGVIYSFDPATSVYSKLKDFQGADGSYVNGRGSLIEASDGKLYGVTSRGGKDNFGVLFSYDPRSGAYSSFLEFNGTNGKYPDGGLVETPDGQLYGMIRSDQITQDGLAIFVFNITTRHLSFVKIFEDYFGSTGSGSMLLAKDGKLYGLKIIDEVGFGGTLFSLDPASGAFNTLKGFHYRDYVHNGLTLASNGKIYGTTLGLGEVQYDNGTIFSYDPSSSEYKVELDFNDVIGRNPSGGLAEGPGGKLYGISEDGYNRHFFSFNISSGIYSNETAIGTNASGSSPTGPLTLGADKKLYGMTTYGGRKGYGTIFSYDLATSTFKKLKDFDYADGTHPQGGLLLSGTDVLYGSTHTGGSGRGVIFSFNLATSTYKKLKEFTYRDGSGWEGSGSYGSLIRAADGKLYWLSPGFSAGIFSYDPKDSTFRNLHTFVNSEGTSPFGSLLEASDGILYGLTSQSTIFSFDPKSSAFSLIYNRVCCEPKGSLIMGADGKMYGMTSIRQNYDLGVIFSVTPSVEKSYRVVYNLNSTDGSYPYGNLMQSKNGKLYGLTSGGGSCGFGVIFSYDPSSRRYTKLKDFNGKNGAVPLYGSGFLEVSDAPVNTPPILSGIGNKTVNELQRLKFVATASDKDDPADSLSFRLANAANRTYPEGATINAKTGLFSWTPTEAQGPGTYRVKVIVSDGSSTDEEEIEIGVLETAAHPVLATIGAKSVNEGTTLNFTAIATDSDLPATPLRYSLVKVKGTNFPEGATINPESGAFIWTPDEFQGPGEYCLIVMVSDGECTDEERILITVNEVNSPPSFTKGPDVTIFEESRRQVINAWAKDISPGAGDEKDQTVHFLVSNNNSQLFSEQPAVSPDGTLTFAAALNICGIAKVTVILNDSGGSALGGADQSLPQTFLITVNSASINLFAYPNPFGKNTTVGFTLPAPEDRVVLDLNDLKGALIQRIYVGKGEANQTQKFAFDGSGFSPGIYFLRLVTSGTVKNFKIIMIE
ncbi:choice-of-anchor tandem repeat GloVer-containing protein [Daejeonella oryzae]|uniref:choice-of-anchor tandem repeat GloVer-containing protein n=1 Tax=Daejeonella oryzae TaxID=1122943 RepID=UPI0003FC8FA2|nr:choice-of-anchor tandem repeat GloVer-containing protein [Daejeonella oryzae]